MYQTSARPPDLSAELRKKLRNEEKIKEIKNENEKNKEAKNQGTIMNSLSCLAAAVAEIFYFFPH